ncbi:ATP-binding protein [Thalassospira alkalitolerans]|uniref:Histidine kinase n=1 Tax=Thalassospira alkalitolerans TaxID=1293890 RepID=A0A1Y2L8D2_9PROT|nr:ATP-binding protein [Thalassospira alkalitolerans]OSQ42271.1 histidine kinase [Thalassospira alkalitolerans]
MNEKEYEINIDPRILELLGPSLYTNIYYILGELLANAYDANAKNVYVIEDEDDSIIVEDDGAGMSYVEGDVQKYLHVAQETRTSPDDAYVSGSGKQRRKMGRKGVGKLAALSVSENVEIHTIKDGDKSGFILSRHVADDKKLEAIPEENVIFRKVEGSGTSIVMKNPQYKLHRTLDVVAKNLLKIFPMVDETFRIHVVRGAKERVIKSVDESLVKDLGALITLGDPFRELSKYFDCQLNEVKNANSLLMKNEEHHEKKIKLKNKQGREEEYAVVIKGWVGAYRSTRGHKQTDTDFPDNFISLLSNKKLGEFNILPIVGKNALNEVYIVGQLHVDLFEETELPDMALSNRQGYKSDDPRFQMVKDYVKNELLPKIVSLRAKYTALKKEKSQREKQEKDKKREQTFKGLIENFKIHAAESAVKNIAGSADNRENLDMRLIQDAVAQAINMNLPDMGVKSKIDSEKRRILLSHTKADKAVCDFVYKLLLFNDVPPEHIIYTNSENAESRIPVKFPQVEIFEYLREFFVESYSTEKIFVLYVTSEQMSKSWGAVSEVGAGWIAKSDHDVISIDSYVPQQPLNTKAEWTNISHGEDGVVLESKEADKIAEKMVVICKYLGYEPKSKELNLQETERIASVVAPE